MQQLNMYVFVFMEFLMLLQAYFAYKDKYLFMWQAERLYHDPGKAIAVWIQHFGMWSDFFILTAVCAFIAKQYYALWTRHDMLVAALISGVVSIVLLILWAKGSKCLDEHLARNERLTRSGWLHGLYMLIALFLLMMFFVFTPHSCISPDVVRKISSLVMAHVILGFVCPELITYKKVTPRTWMIGAGLWGLIIYCWYEIAR